MLTHDLRDALRSFARWPGFSALVILTLALGVGASTTVFGLVNGVLLKPLPYRHAEQLLAVWQANPGRGETRTPVSLPDFRDWQAQATSSIDAIAAYPAFASFQGLVLLGEGEPTELRTGYVSVNFFDVLGVPPAIGRTFRPEEGEPGHNRVVVLSEPFWRDRFGRDPSVVGRSITLDGGAFTVVGVAPAGIALPNPEVELWAPLSIIDSTRVPHHLRNMRWLATIVRARPGATAQPVHAELRTIAQRLAAEYPAENTGWSDVTVQPLQREIVGESSSALWILLGAVGFLLVISCANVANLLLMRGAARQRELAVRTAIGASRGRMIRQLLTESLVLGLSAGVVGLAAATGAVDLVLQLAGPRLPRAAEITVDPRVATFAVALSVATSLCFGLLPALGLTGQGAMAVLREGGRAGSGPGIRRLRRGLVVLEFGFALSLLAAGGLLLNSLWRLSHVQPGFEARSVLAVEFVIPTSTYPQRAQYLAQYEAILDRVRHTPGVIAAAGTQVPPGAGSDESINLTRPGSPSPVAGEPEPTALWRTVSPDYFRVLGIPLVRGRDFSPADRNGTPQVAIVSRELAQRMWPGDEAVGQVVQVNGESLEIVGVAGDVRYAGLYRAPEPVLYQPQTQNSRRRVALLVRGDGLPDQLVRPVAEAIHAVDRNQPIKRIRPLEEVVETSAQESRFLSVVLGSFAILAVVLCGVGLYSVIAYAVAQRGREIAIRLSLGARRSQVLGMVLREGLWLTVAGAALGLIGAFGAGRILANRLFGVAAGDPPTLIAVVIVMLGVGLLACWVPALRATRVAPVEALRSE